MIAAGKQGVNDANDDVDSAVHCPILAARLTSRIAVTSGCETADGTILCVAEILVDLDDVTLVR
jgi:hypothetical protein